MIKIKSFSTLTNTIILTLFGFSSALILSYGYIESFMNADLPSGWDSSGHFVMSQLYFEQHFPKMDGHLNSFFQGFHFPRFYPPLYYWLCGFFYWLLPGVEKVLIFKFINIASVLVAPSFVGIFAQKLGFTLKHSILCTLISAFLFTTGDLIASSTIGLAPALEVGLATQALGGLCLIALLCVSTTDTISLTRSIFIIAFSAIFFISNYHVIITGTMLIFTFYSLLRLNKAPLSAKIYYCIIVGFAIVSPWYFNALIHKFESPAIPLGQLNMSSSSFGLVLIYIIPLSIVQLLVEPAPSKKSIFCLASLIIIPLLLSSTKPLGLSIAWQPERLWSVLSLFLPIYLVHCYLLFKEFINIKAPELNYRMKLFGAIGFVTFLVCHSMLELKLGTLSKEESQAIKQLNVWLKNNPTNGYTVVPFSNSESLVFEVAISHYAALSGEKMIWSIFRESSFNSVFATAVRNFISSKHESYGIPQYTPHNNYKNLPLELKVDSLARWGIARIILSKDNLSFYMKEIPNLQLEYSSDLISVLQLAHQPRLDFHASKAYIFVGTPIKINSDKKSVDFGAIGEYITTTLIDYDPVLLFTNCNDIRNKLPIANIQIACSELDMHSCCTNEIFSVKKIFKKQLLNDINLHVLNRSWIANQNLLVAPWREANLIQLGQ